MATDVAVDMGPRTRRMGDIKIYGGPALFRDPTYGDTLYVDTVNGSDNNSGKSWERAFATMTVALAAITKDLSRIFVTGRVAEHCTAPLGYSGVQIIGANHGRPRHDAGAKWAANAGAAPLITIREQGWEFHNLLFVPQSGYSAIRAHRAESATYPDSSHFIVGSCKFIGPGGIGTPQGIGIEDWGGNHHYLVFDSEFNDLEYAIEAPLGSPGIAAPLRNEIRNNLFEGNKHDICMDGNKCRVLDNQFMTAYNAVTHPNTVNMKFATDVSGANRIVGNYFADAAADVTIAKGYVPSTGDVWRNYVTNTAAAVVTVPA